MKRTLTYEDKDIKRAIKADAEAKNPGMAATVLLEIAETTRGYGMGEETVSVIECSVALTPATERGAR